MKRCFIIGGGSFDGFFDQVTDADLVIAADKGYKYAKEAGILPDYIIGDFDSASKPDFKNLIALNPIKGHWYHEPPRTLHHRDEWKRRQAWSRGFFLGQTSHFLLRRFLQTG